MPLATDFAYKMKWDLRLRARLQESILPLIQRTCNDLELEQASMNKLLLQLVRQPETDMFCLQNEKFQCESYMAIIVLKLAGIFQCEIQNEKDIQELTDAIENYEKKLNIQSISFSRSRELLARAKADLNCCLNQNDEAVEFTIEQKFDTMKVSIQRKEKYAKKIQDRARSVIDLCPPEYIQVYAKDIVEGSSGWTFVRVTILPAKHNPEESEHQNHVPLHIAEEFASLDIASVFEKPLYKNEAPVIRSERCQEVVDDAEESLSELEQDHSALQILKVETLDHLKRCKEDRNTIDAQRKELRDAANLYFSVSACLNIRKISTNFVLKTDQRNDLSWDNCDLDRCTLRNFTKCKAWEGFKALQ